ncbi:hypothetical protein G7054_g7950 [Neopestalotiopsis clavispora]|nr:hypothetical protein G7054_g7950 [Neopestalotiopsis clavispora]
MPLKSQLYELWEELSFPWQLLWLSFCSIPPTVAGLMREHKLDILLSPSRFQEAWFNDFWGKVGADMKAGAVDLVLPLLDGRVSGGKILDEPVGPGIGGVCIELRAGSGFWVDIFSDEHLESPANGQRTRVTRVYGIEPNRDQHVNLRKKIAEAGLEDQYEIVPVGIEDLGDVTKWGNKIEKESVDCIVSIRCLCSVPEPEHNIQELYGYLKKGGRWYVFEHVRAETPVAIRLYQAFLNLIWPTCLGGCQLDRTTGEYILNAGPWTKADCFRPVDQSSYACTPHIFGVYTK